MHLVTGGAGFIGSHLTTRLVELGGAVRVIDDLSRGRLEHLTPVRDSVDLITGDVRNGEVIRRAMAGVEVVYHHAAEPSVARSIDDPHTTFDVNVRGTLNVLLAARDAGCRRVVFASSSSVYGDTPQTPQTELLLPAPLSPYAASKLAGEQLCAVFSRVYGLETVALRYFNVFGPRGDPASAYAAVIPRLLTALLRGETPTIYGDGEQSRDFVYIDNVVEANLRAAAAPGVSGQVFNIATGHAVTLNELLAALQRLTGCSASPVQAPDRPGDIRHSLADISRAEASLGYRVVVPFDKGLAGTVAAARRVTTPQQ
jgi:UDP-glucose 4-epimerase